MFDAQQTLDDLKLPPFPFKGLDGETYELPHLQGMLTGDAEQLDAKAPIDIILDFATPEAVAAIKAMPVAVSTRLAEAWAAHSEKTEGESAASSRSSASTARPSKPTSRSAASQTRKR